MPKRAKEGALPSVNLFTRESHARCGPRSFPSKMEGVYVGSIPITRSNPQRMICLATTQMTSTMSHHTQRGHSLELGDRCGRGGGM